MDVLSKFVLTQSLEHITLLHFLNVLILMLGIPYLSFVTAGICISSYFHRKSEKAGNPFYRRLAQDVIEITTINKSAAITLGIIPLFMLIFSYLQLMQGFNLYPVKSLIYSSFFLIVAYILLFVYRYSFEYSSLFGEVERSDNTSAELRGAVKEHQNKLNSMQIQSSRWSLITMLAGTYFFISGISAIILSSGSVQFNQLSDVIFSLTSLLRWLYFMQLAFALTGALLLFNTFIWQGGRKDILSDHSEYIKNLSFKIISVSIFVQPLFLLFYFLSFPSAGLTTSIFAISLSLIALYFVICIVLYFMMKESHTKFSGAIFILLLLSSILFVVMEETTLANSTREQALALANQNELSLKELEKSIGGPSTISGSEVYKLRCSSCHRFDVKVVGPPYKQTMPKYEGKESELAAFILNPKKVNPAFPQMPNPGVKPAEARAVAKYILSEYKK